MITNVLEYLEESARRYPEKTAFADEFSEISYSRLTAAAKSAGVRIAKSVNTVNRPVFVFADRSVSGIILFFGVLYSGNFYVPVESALPAARINQMYDIMNPAAVLYTDKKDTAALEHRKCGIFISFEETQSVFEECSFNVLSEIRTAHTDLMPLYAMFTSGSTGVPKAVLISHRSVINMSEQFSLAFDFSENTVFANQAPFDFDVSVKDIYSAIKHGATVHIIPKNAFSAPLKVVNFLNERKVNTLIWAVSAMRILAVFDTFSKAAPKTLKQVMFSGEAIPVKILNYWRSHLPNAEFINLYGPTEITCNCAYYKIARDFAENSSPPIGKAFKNTEIILLDGDKAAKYGEIGEICVKGSCLALGYYKNAEKTAAAFTQNPLNAHYPEKIYRTGDLARLDDNGDLIFCGRKDHQIKHMGHRIELGEIEAAVNSVSFIDFCCCLYDEKNEKIMLFYQAAKQCDAEITKEILKLLPKFMMPRKIVHFSALPLNKNGKIDRVYLKNEYGDK